MTAPRKLRKGDRVRILERGSYYEGFIAIVEDVDNPAAPWVYVKALHRGTSDVAGPANYRRSELRALPRSSRSQSRPRRKTERKR